VKACFKGNSANGNIANAKAGILEERLAFQEQVGDDCSRWRRLFKRDDLMATYYCKSAAITIADKSRICSGWISEMPTNFIFFCDEVLKLRRKHVSFLFRKGCLGCNAECKSCGCQRRRAGLHMRSIGVVTATWLRFCMELSVNRKLMHPCSMGPRGGCPVSTIIIVACPVLFNDHHRCMPRPSHPLSHGFY
jgi:hypothetical protein